MSESLQFSAQAGERLAEARRGSANGEGIRPCMVQPEREIVSVGPDLLSKTSCQASGPEGAAIVGLEKAADLTAARELVGPEQEALTGIFQGEIAAHDGLAVGIFMTFRAHDGFHSFNPQKG